jgi:hypothetical protein
MDESEGEATWSSRGNTLDSSEVMWSACAFLPDNAESAATSRRKGSFNWDREHGSFNLEWVNLAEFKTWCDTEELACSIEFIASSSWAGGALYTWKQRFLCRHQELGGVKEYEKKHPERH